MPHDSVDDGVPRAASIRAGCCEHGTVMLELFDTAGGVIARADMPMDSFAGLVSQVQDDLAFHKLNYKPASDQ